MTTSGPSSPRPTRFVVIARVLLVGVLLLLAVVVLSSSSSGPDALLVAVRERLGALGVPSWALQPERAEQVANVVILVPVGVLGTLAFPRLRWQDWAAYAFLGALTVEVVQGLLLPLRQMSASDVVANTLGLLLGSLAVKSMRLRRRPGRLQRR